jgi:esterase/lipase superfamily enzyme
MNPRARNLSAIVVVILGCVSLAGCGGKKPQLMPTPSLYTHPEFNAFASVPPALQGNKIEVLYVTDRAPQKSKDGNMPPPDNMRYGKERSRSTAFGVAELQIGEDNLSWEQLVAQSRTAKRDIKKLDLEVVSTRELGRFAPTPPSLVIFGHGPPPPEELQKMRAAEAETEKKFHAQLTAQLARTPRKEVYIFIHGFNVDFTGSILTIGEMWHFLGREGVPVAYSWPAGQGVLRAYEYTNQSALFTIYHLKQTLKLIASCPAVEKVHVIAHSRGTAVATDAVRELVLEIRGKGDLQKELKLGRCALAAADLDFDVVLAQNVNARAGEAVEANAVYVFKGDKALQFSNWLTGGSMRLGNVSTEVFSKEEIQALRNTTRIQLIDARITKSGSFGHSYFHDNPAVSSDLILHLRYNLPPGSPDGRPLEPSDTGFWIIGDNYPGPIDAAWFQSIPR